MGDALQLLWVLLLPLGAAAAVAAMPSPGPRRAVALAVQLAVLALVVAMSLHVDGALPRHAFDVPAIPALGVNLHFALDGLDFYFVLLAALVFPAVLACAWRAREGSSRLFVVALLALEGLLLGTFLAKDLVVLFSLWEAVLIPAVVMILAFGGRERRRAALVFFLYTMAGSVLMLAAVVLLGVEAHAQVGRWTFDLDVLRRLRLPEATQTFVFLAMALACAVKSPLVPFHAWLPLAYREASTPVTALMAGVMSKMGAFGFLALAIPLAPEGAARFGPAVMALAAASIAYGAVLALRQRTLKDIVAYASLSHMGYIALGAFAFRAAAVHGALFQVLSHGLAVTGLFLLVALLEHRRGALALPSEGLATRAPRMAVALMLFVLASLALPLTSGFTAEFLVLAGAWAEGLASLEAGRGATAIVAAAFATTGVVLGATYMLRFARAALFTPPVDAAPIADLRAREAVALGALLVLVVWIGVQPAPWMRKVDVTATTTASRSAP